MRRRYHKSPKAQRINNRIAYVACRIGAPILFLVGAVQMADRFEILTTRDAATGTIVGADYRDPGYSKSGAPLISSKVRFQTADGQEVVFDSGYSTAKSDEIGRTVSVRYDPDRPENAVIVDFLDFWVTPLFVLGIAVMLWFMGSAARSFVPPGMNSEDVLGTDAAPEERRGTGKNG
jgi:hypothetical protein